MGHGTVPCPTFEVVYTPYAKDGNWHVYNRHNGSIDYVPYVNFEDVVNLFSAGNEIYQEGSFFSVYVVEGK